MDFRIDEFDVFEKRRSKQRGYEHGWQHDGSS